MKFSYGVPHWDAIERSAIGRGLSEQDATCIAELFVDTVLQDAMTEFWYDAKEGRLFIVLAGGRGEYAPQAGAIINGFIAGKRHARVTETMLAIQKIDDGIRELKTSALDAGPIVHSLCVRNELAVTELKQ